MATTWLIEEEGAVDDDDGLLKAPRKNRLLTVSRQLQFILCKSNKYKEFEYLVSRPIAEDGGPTAVVASTKNDKKSTKMAKKAGQRIEYALKKGAKYFGIAVIKIFNQPQAYTEDSRVHCVC